MSRYIPDGISLKLTKTNQFDDCREYEVIEESTGRQIGIVKSERSESWRRTSSGVRYGYNGNPKEWNGWVKTDDGFEYATPSTITTRIEAIQRVIRADEHVRNGDPIWPI